MAAMLQEEIEFYRKNLDAGEQKTFYIRLKRLLDLTISVLGLIVTLPIMLIVAILIKLESPGPIIYRQRRCGQYGKEFIMYKFRSMKANAEAETGAVWAQENDPRVTRLGKFLRKTRIDELPQFVNIIKGDMSLVGPRPERPELVEEFEKSWPGFKGRMIVKPGVTGLAQIEGGYNLSPKEKALKDQQYIKNRSLRLDLRILLRTIVTVITGNGAR